MKYLTGMLVALCALSPAASQAQWKYASKKDAMTDEVTKSASLNSKNAVNLQFPYGPNIKGYLVIQPDKQSDKREADVLVASTAGQILTNQGAVVRFGIEKENWLFDLTKIRGGSSAGGFLTFPGYLSNCSETDKKLCEITSSQFIKKMASSPTMKVKVVFFQDGDKTFDFQTIGLLWTTPEESEVKKDTPLNISGEISPKPAVAIADQPPVNRSKLRLGIRYLDESMVLKLPQNIRDQLPKTGIVVYLVDSGSVAEASGFMPGDVLTKFNQIQINTPVDMAIAMQATPAGKQVEAEVARGGSILKLKVTL